MDLAELVGLKSNGPPNHARLINVNGFNEETLKDKLTPSALRSFLDSDVEDFTFLRKSAGRLPFKIWRGQDLVRIGYMEEDEKDWSVDHGGYGAFQAGPFKDYGANQTLVQFRPMAADSRMEGAKQRNIAESIIYTKEWSDLYGAEVVVTEKPRS